MANNCNIYKVTLLHTVSMALQMCSWRRWSDYHLLLSTAPSPPIWGSMTSPRFQCLLSLFFIGPTNPGGQRHLQNPSKTPNNSSGHQDPVEVWAVSTWRPLGKQVVIQKDFFSLIKSQYGGRGERWGETLQGAREETERGRRHGCQDRQTSAAR